MPGTRCPEDQSFVRFLSGLVCPHHCWKDRTWAQQVYGTPEDDRSLAAVTRRLALEIERRSLVASACVSPELLEQHARTLLAAMSDDPLQDLLARNTAELCMQTPQVTVRAEAFLTRRLVQGK